MKIKDLENPISNDKEMEAFLSTNAEGLMSDAGSLASGKHDIDLLIVTGKLAHYLQNHPRTKKIAKILYWLGMGEYALNRNMFFAVGDLYLKECVRLYSKDPMAKLCYQAYEDEINFRYTGSIGTKLPAAKVNELKKLKSLLK